MKRLLSTNQTEQFCAFAAVPLTNAIAAVAAAIDANCRTFIPNLIAFLP
jgi:hypothetical protein